MQDREMNWDFEDWILDQQAKNNHAPVPTHNDAFSTEATPAEENQPATQANQRRVKRYIVYVSECFIGSL